ncbi:TPA: hypothetical protein OMU28_002051 [Klebsiella aerogenes]|nr:hypothetical protein [Klebsiella aerogenes]
MRDNIEARGHEISNKRLRRALKTLTHSALDLQAQQAGAVRYDIHGLPAGSVSEEKAQFALKRLAALSPPEAGLGPTSPTEGAEGSQSACRMQPTRAGDRKQDKKNSATGR